MPNWCTNRVRIYLDDMSEEEQKKFREEIDFPLSEDAEFSFQKILPCPEELITHSTSVVTQEKYDEHIDKKAKGELSKFDTEFHPMTQEMADEFIEKYGHKNWYDWRYANWGVKWDVDDKVYIEENHEDSIELEFDTAWGPAEGIHNHLTKTYPNISISWFYDEPGMEFAGYL